MTAPDSPVDTRADTYAPFRYRDYRLFIAMVLIASLCQQALGVAVGWDIYERTGSVMALGWVGLAQFIPVLLFFLPAGQLADRYDRRRIVAVSLTLWVAASILLVWSAWRNAPVFSIYAALFAIGAATILNRAGRDALLSQLVPPAALARAVMWNSTVFQTASVAGPALAGLLIASSAAVLGTAGGSAGGAALVSAGGAAGGAAGAAAGVAGVAGVAGAAGGAAGSSAIIVYAFNLIGMLIAMVLALSIRHHPLTAGQRPSTWAGVFGGLVHVWQTKVVLGLITIDLFAVLLGGAVALLPVYAKDVLNTGAAGLGWLAAAPAIGAVAMAFVHARARGHAHAGRTFLWAVGVFGLATIVFGLSRWYWLSFAALVLVGAADNVGAVIRQTAVQLYTPDQLRGRVAAVNRVFISSSNELGAVESGLLASLTNPVFAVVAGGVVTLLIAAGGFKMFPDLRTMKTVGG